LSQLYRYSVKNKWVWRRNMYLLVFGLIKK
jgi:hypothetical protein